MKCWVIGFALCCLILTCSTSLYDDPPFCDCRFRVAGCAIRIPPPEGYKCQCILVTSWTCEGRTIKCAPGEDCPENCVTKECCLNGGGDCCGYPGLVCPRDTTSFTQ